MSAVILFRASADEEDEKQIASQYLPVIDSRCQCQPGQTVIGRYSVLPYYKELSKDIEAHGARLINSFEQHLWIADFEYYHDLEQFTPQSWYEHNFHLCEHPGPFVVKGRTNSRKHQWNKKMFATSKQGALTLARELSDDPLIAGQGIIFREYIPLVTYEVGLNDLPFTNEWRIFYLGTKRLSHGYYWSLAENKDREIAPEGLAFADTVAKIAAEHANFFVLDVAEKQEGGWTLIEVNDGQMSGLSENKPEVLYRNLAEAAI